MTTQQKILSYITNLDDYNKTLLITNILNSCGTKACNQAILLSQLESTNATYYMQNEYDELYRALEATEAHAWYNCINLLSNEIKEAYNRSKKLYVRDDEDLPF